MKYLDASELRELIIKSLEYSSHTPGCDFIRYIPNTGKVCSCGYAEFKRRLYQLGVIEEYEE